MYLIKFIREISLERIKSIMNKKVKLAIKKSPLFPSINKIRISYINYFPQSTISYRYNKFYNRKMSWDKPVFLSEKMQIFKWAIYPRNERVVEAADKYTLHTYLASKKLSKYSVPFIKVYESIKDFNLEELPKAFVLKKTNASGMNLIVKDKNEITETEIKDKIKMWLEQDFGRMNLEPHYSQSKNRVICEPFFPNLGDEYRLFMVNGEVGFIQVIIWDWDLQINGLKNTSNVIEGHRKHYRIYCSKNWDILWKDDETPIDDILIPNQWEELLQVSLQIAKDFPVVRVDFNMIDDQYKITELTFTPANCYLEILKNNPNLDLELGKMIPDSDLL